MYLTKNFTHRHLSVLALAIGISFPMFAIADTEAISRVDTVTVAPETYVETTIPRVDPVTKVVSTTTKSTVDTNVVRRARYPHRHYYPHRHHYHPHTSHTYQNVSNSRHETRESTVTTGTTTLENRDGGPKSVILQPGVVYHGVGSTN
jgi:G3E family GTPase